MQQPGFGKRLQQSGFCCVRLQHGFIYAKAKQLQQQNRMANTMAVISVMPKDVTFYRSWSNSFYRMNAVILD